MQTPVLFIHIPAIEIRVSLLRVIHGVDVKAMTAACVGPRIRKTRGFNLRRRGSFVNGYAHHILFQRRVIVNQTWNLSINAVVVGQHTAVAIVRYERIQNDGTFVGWRSIRPHHPSLAEPDC